MAVEIGRGLRHARLSARLTGDQVAAAASLPPEVYGRMERGKLLPTLPTLILLCRVLDIRPEWLRRGAPPSE